jgi:hypothetical protein
MLGASGGGEGGVTEVLDLLITPGLLGEVGLVGGGLVGGGLLGGDFSLIAV